jgi:hypothetical protein
MPPLSGSAAAGAGGGSTRCEDVKADDAGVTAPADASGCCGRDFSGLRAKAGRAAVYHAGDHARYFGDTMKGFGLSLLVAGAALLAGCAGRIGELPAVPAGEVPAELVLIRVSSLVGVTKTYYVTLDGRNVFAIRSGQHTMFPIPAGQHFVGVKCSKDDAPLKENAKGFTVAPRQPIYYEISPNPDCGEIEQVPATEADARIADSKFIDPTKD